LRKKFLVEQELDEQRLKSILDPILTGAQERTTHKVRFSTTKGILEFFSIPLKNPSGRYSSAAVNGTLRKIILWDKRNTNSLQDHLLTNGIKLREIVKDGPKTLELKKK
jgi:hypothetical protein